ncbi:MAG: chromosome segregation protein SMC [Desulfuromonadales bacterium]|nr:chromosome segregation protein SMC [Desulfuromonadales bacterium]
MKIKRIEITGFKSFVERTVLSFDEGITSIVGPNGCGKSNVVDAIRWVMGEQNARHLRGKMMEDVIFGGSEERKPLGMAEVTLVMDNSARLGPTAFREYSEIQITRRLYRNGDSEYLLNKTPCRLLDITELFMDTGVGTRAYSIIEQGKIGMIINSKPEDRRSLIEEAAGVTKFKSRKKSAQRKIEATRQNLLRLGDIVSEVRRQMNSLKRQAQRAKRFTEFREELRGVELQFALRRYSALSEQAKQSEQSSEQQTSQVDAVTRKLEATELGLEQARLRHTERDQEASQAQEQVFHLTSEIQRIESRLEFGGRELDSLDKQRERIAGELQEIEQRLTTADQEEQTLQQTQSDHSGMLLTEQEKLVEQEEHLQDLLDREDSMERQLEQVRQKLYHLLSELTRMSSRQEEADRRLAVLSDLCERNRHEAVALQDQQQRLESNCADLTTSLTAIEHERDALTTKRQQLHQRQATLKEESEQVEVDLLGRREEFNRQGSRLESLQQLEQNLEGYARGVKTLLSAPEHKARMQGVVADILEVPPRYEAAVEAALGERVQSLVPGSLDDVTSAFDFLREQEGRCTFLLPDFPPVDAPVVPNATPLTELLRGDKELPAMVERLLGGVYLVPELAHALNQALPFGATLVTEEGDLLTCRGEITGGGRQALDQGLLHKKREMKELAQQVQQLEQVVAELNRKREGVREELFSTDAALRQVESDLHQQELKVVDSRKDLDGLKQEETRLQERVEVLNLEEEQLHEEQTTLQQTLQSSTSSRQGAETQKRDLEGLVATLQQELQSLREQASEVRQGVTSLKVNLAGMREREENNRTARQRLAQLREELQRRQITLSKDGDDAVTRQTDLRKESERLKVEMEVLYRTRLEKEQTLIQLRERFEASRQDIEAREADLKQLRGSAGQLREQLASCQMQVRELSLEIEHVRQNFDERYRLDLAAPEVAAQLDLSFEEESATQRRDYLQKRIDEIGEVNLMAIDEFEELEQRYTFLTVQQEDLQTSLEGLQAAITKINRTTRKRFRETFDLVNAQFRELFPRLFNGGQAELQLTDENDLLETGIEVVAQPPGKKLQNVTLLSGGEKALTAVAMIFSIFMIKPSPFCLLDEVDAPLDDANIGRFNEIVTKMAATSQFIIITHNKRTMEIADNLYGITMEEPGVSKLVSVCMKEVA